MKKTLSTVKFLSSLFLCSLLLALCYLSCEQPFKAGLGPIVDLQDPTISPMLSPDVNKALSPAAGAYIRGVTEFTGSASDDYKLDSVGFYLANYPGVELYELDSANYKQLTPPENEKTRGIEPFHRITDTNGTDRKISWSFKIDTMLLKNGERVFPDGEFRIRLIVIDHAKKIGLTDEIVFYIKNDIPEITIDAPPVTRGKDPGMLGGEHLNYDFLNNSEPTGFRRVMDTKSMIVGRISDNEGIYQGPVKTVTLDDDGLPLLDNKGDPIINDDGAVSEYDPARNPHEVNLFPPQMRFWQVSMNGDTFTTKDGTILTAGKSGDNLYDKGYIPTEAQVQWKTIGKEIGELMQTGSSLTFMYTLPDESGAYYAVQVRAQSVDRVKSKAEYPRDYIDYFDKFSGQDLTGNVTDPVAKESLYVLILVREPLEYPALELYQLQEIYGPPRNEDRQGVDYFGQIKPLRGTNGIMYYNRQQEITDKMETDGNHVYVDKPIVNKDGAFTLRVKASHSGGIKSAKVFWEKDDKSMRGRFIWDPPVKPYDIWRGIVPSENEPFYKWGLNEPDGGTLVRSFVFTYTDNTARDKIPNDSAFEGSFVRGKSKVQLYNGPRSTSFDDLEAIVNEADIADQWEDLNRNLPEGTYNLSIYATSSSGTRIASPFTVTISIDRTEPDIRLNYIQGSAYTEKLKTDAEEYIVVNGVISPRFILSESLATDTGFRKGNTKYFRRLTKVEKNNSTGKYDYTYENDSWYSEQAYILIPANQKIAMDTYLKSDPKVWPFPDEFPETMDSYDWKINGVTVKKHGPIFDFLTGSSSACRFKTSKIYEDSTENGKAEKDYLDDGDYLMYVFARDNAFNVGRGNPDSAPQFPIPIRVRRSSDNPVFEWPEGSVVEKGVIEPDSKWDYAVPSTTTSDAGKGFIVLNKDTNKTRIRNKISASASIQIKIKDDDSLDLGDKDAPSKIKVTFTGSEPDASGVIQPKTGAGYEMELSDEQVKEAFPPQTLKENGERILVKEITGEISQSVLLELLKNNDKYNYLFGVLEARPDPANPGQTLPADTADEIKARKDAYNSLPDGIYRIGITIQDFNADYSKLKMPTDPKESPADFIKVGVNSDIIPPLDYFWIAVDSKNPEIAVSFTTDTPKGPTPPSGQYLSKNTPAVLEGVVSDENGPVTLINWKVVNVSGNKVESQMGATANLAVTGDNPPKPVANNDGTPKIDIVNPPLTSQGYSGGKWKYKFSYKMNMNGRDNGTYNFELEFQDRFGNKSKVSLRYSIDNEPPKVSLTRPIETFSRPFDDVILKPSGANYPLQTGADALNKERLAVKTVNFSINATDNYLVTGVRWWLLPWNVNATAGGMAYATNNQSGNVLDYDAWPSSKFKSDPAGKTYYAVPDGFDFGAYGTVSVEPRRYTIAIDTTKMPEGGNGQYRLHIIAADDAGNYSYVTQDVNKETTSNFFQEVYFLQEEDKPYFGINDNSKDPNGNSKNNITPGYAFTGATWPKENGKDVDMDVRSDISPMIRGTIFENNGFFQGDGTTLSWPGAGKTGQGSITIWFSESAVDAEKALPSDLVDPDTGAASSNGIPRWEYIVKTGGEIKSSGGAGWPNYTKKQIPQDLNGGLGKQGRNISLAIELAKLFPDAFEKDGKKRYIIKATDSPVNKLWYDGAAGIEMGKDKDGYTVTEDETVRVSRWRQFAFIYDAKDPEVVLTRPTKDTPFGKNFSKDFIISGSIADANLKMTADGKYYFEYYLDNETARTIFKLNFASGVSVDNPILVDGDGAPLSGQPAIPSHTVTDSGGNTITVLGPADSAIKKGEHIYAVTSDPDGKITVYFIIGAAEISAEGGILPLTRFNSSAFAEGQHSLSVFAWDKSGREGAAWANFTKDLEPPTVTFSNLSTGYLVGNNRPYNNLNANDKQNESKVDKASWWLPAYASTRSSLLFGFTDSTLTKRTLPLATISYDTAGGVPELRGTITDLVSNIKLYTESNTAAINVGTGDINMGDPSDLAGPKTSAFRYWIDGDLAVPRFFAVITGKGSKSVQWTINLTDDGKLSGKKLYDGVHTIVIRAEDEAGLWIPKEVSTDTDADERHMIAFRIDSKPPKAAVKPKVDSSLAGVDVYGNASQQAATMFTLELEASDANLDRVELKIVRIDEAANSEELLGTIQKFTTNTAGWTYTPGSMTGPTDDKIEFKGSHAVLSSLFPTAPPANNPKYEGGKYEARVKAYDTANNESEEYVFPFFYDIVGPEIIFNSPDDGTKNARDDLMPENFINKNDMDQTEFGSGAGKITINRLFSESLKIMGEARDSVSAVRQVQSRIEKWNWDSKRWDITTPLQDWTNLRNDLYYPVSAGSPPDSRNNKLTQISWTKNLLGQNGGDLDLVTGTTVASGPQASGRDLSAAEGLYRIRVRAKDSSYTANGSNKNYASNNWILTGTTADIGNPRVSDYVYFYFDRTNPELKVTNISGLPTSGATYFPKPSGGFTFEGTVKDNNRFAKVEVKFESVLGNITIPAASPLLYREASYTNQVASVNEGPDTQYWKAVFTESGATKFADGRYKVTTTVYDMTGRKTEEVKTFILDSTPPGARFTGPAKKTGYRVNNNDSNPLITLYGSDQDTAPNPRTGFASVIVNGGETSVITGETWDKPGDDGEQGSESGIDQMWFRLGYIDGNNNFPDETAIRNNLQTLIDSARTALATNPNVPANTTITDTMAMDYISEIQENAWFRLGGTRKYTTAAGAPGTAPTPTVPVPVPTGFVINNPNIYDWRFEIPNNYPTASAGSDMTATVSEQSITQTSDNKYYQIGGLKLYGGTIQVKGRKYTVGTGTYQMVRAVDGQAGVYRLPLWIRLVDKAGNVGYYCHDIWIYPDGDIPSTTIESPKNSSKDTPRGGTISVDGVAKSNTSVYDVIFRVFADNVSTSNLDGYSGTVGGNPVYNANKILGGVPYESAPGTADSATLNYIQNNASDKGKLVKINGDYKAADAATLNKLPDNYKPGQKYASAWQRASLTLAGGSGEPLIPWSITLNSENQIANYIAVKGFNASGIGDNNTIRVWLEVFVFNGEGSPIRSSIYPNDNLGTGNGTTDTTTLSPLYGTAAAPKPYVRAFYINTNSANITHPNVGSWTADIGPTGPFTNDFVRANFLWNAENSQNQGNGGYKGAGAEKARGNRLAFSVTLDPSPTDNTGALGEVSYRIKLNGGGYSQWTTAWSASPPAGVTYPAIPFSRNGISISVRDTTAGKGARYWFDYRINSKATDPATDTANNLIPLFNERNEFVNWANTGGTVTIQVRMRDRSSPPNEAEQSIQVGVDNFAPLVEKDAAGLNPSYGNRIAAGSNVDFQGRVFDYATAGAEDAMNTEYTPRKLAKVYAWFTKGAAPATDTAPVSTQYINMATGGIAGVTASTQTLDNVLIGRTATVTYQNGSPNSDNISAITINSRGNNVPNGATVRFPSGADWVREISEKTAIAGSKMVWAPVNSAAYDVRWSFTLDSTKLPDGELTLHYIVVDDAGNASYYCQPTITVKNKYPEINRVTLYTVNLGISAAYTQPDEASYNLNDYRGKMFNNLASYADADKTGYLNSGFISKNNYIGFKVETLKGNRPLNFRLQHVTRQRIKLNPTNLAKMVDNRKANDPKKINLYTIAWHGDYSSNNWKAIGVHEENPTLGTHFVLPFDTVPADFKYSESAEVWQYTEVVTKPDYSPSGAAQSQDATDPVVVERENFYLNGAVDFANIQNSDDTNYDGSHPDYGNGDNKKDDPSKTAFFLIRVWDSVGGVPSGEEAINNRLHDALVVGMNVYKKDTTPPVARLYDLNPYTETAVTGNNNSNDARNATILKAAHPGYEDPQAVGSNIVRGGLFNTGTQSAMVRSGFIDPRKTSKALNLATPADRDLKNGLWYTYTDSGTTYNELISGVQLPDYPLKTEGDLVANGGDQDKVSGKIILRGLAWDDQLIYQIKIKTGTAATIGTATAVPILELDPATARMKAVGAGVLNSGTPNEQIVAFTAETLNWKTGHTVEWAYVWDTGANPGDVVVQVIAEDYKSSTEIPGTDRQESAIFNADGANSYHNQVTVTKVPYITGFERATRFVTKRSLQGWYSFYQGEGTESTDPALIKVKGYNFGNGATAVDTTVTNRIAVSPVAASTSPTERTFSIPASATSGAIALTFGGTPAYNNDSSVTGKSWNKETSAYTPGSELWINRHYAHILRTSPSNPDSSPRTIIGNTSSSVGLNHPGMALEYTGSNAGTLHGTWAVYGNANSHYGTNGSSNNYYALHSGNPGEPYSTPDISIFQGGDASAANIGYTYQADGRALLLARANITTPQGNGAPGNNLILQNYMTNTGSTQRWQNIRVSKAAPNIRSSNNTIAETNVGRFYMTAYNAENKGLWYGTRGGTTVNDHANRTMFIDGGANTSITQSITAAAGSAAAVVNAGEYSAIDYDNIGPIIAYYNGSDDTVRVALAPNDNPEASPTNATARWTRRDLLPADNALYRGSGKYISIKVDRNNGIHLSFYNSVKNTVVYYYALNRTYIGTPPNINNTVKCHAVDNVVTGGTWTDISVDSDLNPWIVYSDSSRTGNYDGVRVAYRSFNGTDAAAPDGAFGRPASDIYGTSIRGWEALTMPANFIVGNDRLNIEAWPPTNRSTTTPGNAPGWNAAVGYTSDMFRVGYFYKPGDTGVTR